MPAKDADKEAPRAQKERRPTDEKKNYSTSEAIISLRDELIEHVKSAREQPNGEHRKKPNWVEIVTLCFVILTTVGIGVQDFILHSSDTTFSATLDQQIKSSERQLRAYVGMIPGDIEDFGIPGKQRIRFTRKNFGLTPAYDVGWSQIGMGIIARGANIPTGAGGCGVPVVAGQFTMFPSTELPWVIAIEKGPDIKPESSATIADILDPALVQLVKTGDRQFVYWGTVCYRDAFGKSHFTNYCWLYKGRSMTARDAEGCLQHNDSD